MKFLLAFYQFIELHLHVHVGGFGITISRLYTTVRSMNLNLILEALSPNFSL